jgi:hypothetical protein
MRSFAWGLLTMANVVASLFFLRYFRASRDRLFAFFAAAFAVMAVDWLGHAVLPRMLLRHDIYLVRLLAFVLIIVGIVDKNRRESPSRRPLGPSAQRARGPAAPPS